MRVSVLVCLVATLLTLPAGQGGPVDTYAGIVEHYRRAPDDATSRMLTMAPDELGRAIEAAVAPDSGWSIVALDAALLMHTDAAIVLDRERDPGAWTQVERADALSAAAAREAENAWFMHRWYSVITRSFPRDVRMTRIRERWGKQAWRPSALALERALWLEAKGASEPSVHLPLIDSNVYAPAQFRQSLEMYEKALSGGMLTAALHLGRIQMLLGREREARVLLTRAAEHSPFPHTRYLGSLLLGSLDELDGHPDDAERRYEAALQSVPHAQSGRLALAALLARGGRSAEAALVIAGRAPDGSLPPIDPWWLYLPADTDDPAVLLARLYFEVRR